MRGAVLLHQLVEAAEEHAPRGQIGVQPALPRATVDGRRMARQIDARGQQRLGTQRVGSIFPSSLLPAPCYLLQAAGTCPSGSGGCRSAAILPAAGPCSWSALVVRPRQVLECLPGIPPQIGQPARLQPRRKKRLECLLGKSGGNGFGHATRRFLPFAIRSSGSFPRRIPSAAP